MENCEPGQQEYCDPRGLNGAIIHAANAKTWHEVRITKVANGFFVIVGCKTFVALNWNDVAAGLDKYWNDPLKAAEEYCK